ncbi:MAG: malto-oligosyltrehalose synthase [Pirellulales bacterium]
MNDVSPWAAWLAQSVGQAVAARRCRPTATYRIQFEPGTMAFRDAATLVPYLHELGVSHLYASPCLKARSGCTHGYAVVDYGQLNPELGGEDGYGAMVEALHGHGMGQILDVVSNHMSATPTENAWWNDVLENGPSSPHAAYFDIDWRPVKEELQNRVLLPILGGQYGQVLESGELELEYREGAFFLRYYEALLPIEPRTYRAVLTHGLDAFRVSQPPDSADFRELESIATALEHLPEPTRTEHAAVAERQREKEVIKGRLRALVDRAGSIADFVLRNVEEFNGTPDQPHSFDCLDELLEAQVYRLSHWKAAADEINYRRFFDINELAAVCMEAPEVFAASHRLIFDLLVRGDLHGLRIDHIDGLYEPMEYLRRLQRGYLLAMGRALYDRVAEAAGQPAGVPDGLLPPWHELEPAFLCAATATTCTDRTELPLYVVAEKILSVDETLPDHWLLAGTTGYDYLNSAGGLLVDPAGLAQLTRIYGRFINQWFDFSEVAHESKLLIFREAMSSDLQLLAHRLNRISLKHRRSRDFTLNALRIALREILACFSVYRTYIREGYVTERDRQAVSDAVAEAKRRNPATDATVFDFIRDVLLLERPPDLDEAGRHERELFVGRVQQVTSPVTAKGIEDTAFYRYFPLASLNEVGGDPLHGVTTVREFHRQNLARQATWPQSMLCTSTHDTKRSQDTRARIHVLSEVPQQWRKAVNRWARLNRRHRREVDGQPAPSRNDEYLFYQTLVGVWPLAAPDGKDLGALTERAAAYMEKATHEAKLHTSWISPRSEYDAAVRDFVTAAIGDHPKNRFLAELGRFCDQIVNWGLYGALSQLLLNLTSPGVPDIYQGQELWDFSLVDPDNRRPVDFSDRQTALAQLKKDADRNDGSLLALSRRLAQNPRDPRLKLLVTWRTLQFRRQHADLFRLGDYVPLEVEGPQAKHLCAFARQWRPPSGTEPHIAVVMAPRLIAQLTPPAAASLPPPPPIGPAVWDDTQIVVESMAPSPLTNLFTGQTCSAGDSHIRVAAALADFPVALLTNVGR